MNVEKSTNHTTTISWKRGDKRKRMDGFASRTTLVIGSIGVKIAVNYSIIIMENQELTFGQKAVGLSFNPANDPTVQMLKELYAKIIDVCNEARDVAGKSEQGRLFSVAITEAQGAQMWAVKAATWKD